MSKLLSKNSSVDMKEIAIQIIKTRFYELENVKHMADV